MFVQIGLPRYVAANAGCSHTRVSSTTQSPMWMGFADQQVDASAPAAERHLRRRRGIT